MSNINTAVEPHVLAPMPGLPRAGRAAKAKVACKCGCGGLTQSTFCPGHDSRHFSWIKRVQRGVHTLEWIAQYASVGEAEATARVVQPGWAFDPESQAAQAAAAELASAAIGALSADAEVEEA